MPRNRFERGISSFGMRVVVVVFVVAEVQGRSLGCVIKHGRVEWISDDHRPIRFPPRPRPAFRFRFALRAASSSLSLSSPFFFTMGPLLFSWIQSHVREAHRASAPRFR